MTIEYVVGGSRTHYGPRDVSQKEAGKADFGVRRQLVVPFDFANLPSVANAGADAAILTVPAGCPVTKAVLKVKTAFTGGTGTGLQIGFEAASGTDIDADGLFLDAQIVSANLVATNCIFGRGAMVTEAPDAAGTAHGDADGVYVIGTTGPVTSVAAYPLITAVTGAYAAGEGVLYIEYLDTRY